MYQAFTPLRPRSCFKCTLSQKTSRQSYERRTNWIDQMKVIGMFFIIWGHLSPEHLKHFIYAFSVPIFFIVSGYLFRCCDWRQFFEKNIRTLLVPYFLLGGSVICFFFFVKYYFGNYCETYFPLSFLSLFVGSQNGIGEGSIGCQALWFVYTLFIIKCIANLILDRWYLHIYISIIFLYIAQWLNELGCDFYSSYTNVLVAYPYFAIGYFIKKKYGNELQQKANNNIILLSRNPRLYIFVLMGLFCVSLGSYLNGMIEMYNSKFGSDLFLFLVDGILGSAIIALLSIRLGNYDFCGFVKILSRGSILILAWQIIFLLFINLVFSKSLGQWINDDIITFIFTILIYASFIPIIKIITKYCPILIGGR